MAIGDLHSEAQLLARCEELAARPSGKSDARVAAIRAALDSGEDPLGDTLCALRPPAERRALGATYTPRGLVDAMVDWARRALTPHRVIDPGAGSGRFLLAAARAFPQAELVGVELDPLAAAVARANLAVANLTDRASILVADYREAALGPCAGPTLFIGNPPYLRHHAIAPHWKAWYGERARQRGLPASRLAGLHLHFLLATIDLARPGDAGALVTAAEWLDVNYGALARAALAGPLGLERLDLVAPTARPFADAQTTAVIAAFRPGFAGPARLRRVDRIRPLEGGAAVTRERLGASARWSELFHQPRRRPAGLVELGELCRVHRGQVTGANHVWIAGPHTPPLPASTRYAAVTRARELFACGPSLDAAEALRRVIDLPAELDAFASDERRLVEAFLRWARDRGADAGYVARHRKPWWSVRLRPPAPILATYMARRPPAFVRNRARARHLNIAHGLYPREVMPEASLDALAEFLTETASIRDGRTYAGGLTKFEPREMERLLVPPPEELTRRAAAKPPHEAAS